jgi:vacuolar iron transporter family protein
MHSHFGEKSALNHVLEKRGEGVKEIHGMELPGHLSAGADAMRETALFLWIVWAIISNLVILAIVVSGFIVWKIGRSAWLGWVRLERLHRITEQEKFEIEHHRPQEREELTALYRAKGFEGKLLEDVIDVLMSDQDRLLKVMLEEELGLTLEAYEHPLKQALGAGFGAILGAIFPLIFSFLFPKYGMVVSSLTMIGLGAFISAFYERNRIVSAIVWNLSIAALAYGLIYFVLNMV